MVAAYASTGATVRLVGRRACRVPISGPAPMTHALDELIASDKLRPSDQRLLLLVAGLEEDSGADVEALFAALSDLARIHLWRTDLPVPNPSGLEEILRDDEAWGGEGHAVQVLLDGKDVRDVFRNDDWAGACAAVVTVSGKREQVLRFRLTSGEGRNDWSAGLKLKVG